MRKIELEERLIQFASAILDFTDKLPAIPPCKHLSNQLMRSGTAPALIYGEAQSADSTKDFIDKMRLALKELRETLICLRIISSRKYMANEVQLKKTMAENDELIAIFVSSIKTAINSELTDQSKPK